MYLYEALAILVSLSLLSYASVEDIRKREVSDKVWLVLFFLGLLVRVIDLITHPTPEYISDLAISMGLPIGLFLLMYYLGLLFGGADAKAFMCMALMVPKPPASTPVIGYLLPFFSLSIFDNTILLSLAMIPLNIVYNVSWLMTGHPLFDGLEEEPTAKKIIAFLTCRKVKASVVKTSPNFHTAEEILQSPDGTKHRRIKLMYRLSDEDEDNVSSSDSEYILAHYYLPLIVFITIGLVASLLVGDLIMLIVKIIMAPFM